MCVCVCVCVCVSLCVCVCESFSDTVVDIGANIQKCISSGALCMAMLKPYNLFVIWVVDD